MFEKFYIFLFGLAIGSWFPVIFFDFYDIIHNKISNYFNEKKKQRKIKKEENEFEKCRNEYVNTLKSFKKTC